MVKLRFYLLSLVIVFSIMLCACQDNPIVDTTSSRESITGETKDTFPLEAPQEEVLNLDHKKVDISDAREVYYHPEHSITDYLGKEDGKLYFLLWIEDPSLWGVGQYTGYAAIGTAEENREGGEISIKRLLKQFSPEIRPAFSYSLIQGKIYLQEGKRLIALGLDGTSSVLLDNVGGGMSLIHESDSILYSYTDSNRENQYLCCFSLKTGEKTVLKQFSYQISGPDYTDGRLNSWCKAGGEGYYYSMSKVENQDISAYPNSSTLYYLADDKNQEVVSINNRCLILAGNDNSLFIRCESNTNIHSYSVIAFHEGKSLRLSLPEKTMLIPDYVQLLKDRYLCPLTESASLIEINYKEKSGIIFDFSDNEQWKRIVFVSENGNIVGLLGEKKMLFVSY